MDRISNLEQRWIYEAERDGYIAGLPELVMLGWDKYTEASPLKYHKHSNAFEFVLVEQGKASWEIGNECFVTGSGEVFHTHPDEWHRARLDQLEPCRIWWTIIQKPSSISGWLGLREEEIDHMQKELDRLPRVIKTGTRLRQSFRRMRQMVAQPTPLSAAEIRHHLLGVLFTLIQPVESFSIPGEIQTSLSQLIDRLKAAPEVRYSVQDLAVEINISESHFFRLFQQMTGQSPASFMERLRVDESCRRLLEPGASVTGIAMDLGFKTSQHFSVVFKRYTGRTPSQWRTEGGHIMDSRKIAAHETNHTADTLFNAKR